MTGAVILALAPIALLIGLGQGMRRVGFLADAFWPQAERLSYYVLLPALFLVTAAVTVYALAVAQPFAVDGLRRQILATLFYVANWQSIAEGTDYWARTSGPSPRVCLRMSLIQLASVAG